MTPTSWRLSHGSVVWTKSCGIVELLRVDGKLGYVVVSLVVIARVELMLFVGGGRMGGDGGNVTGAWWCAGGRGTA